MALSSPQTNNQLIKFRRQIATDFLRNSRFEPWMGDSSSSVIVRMNDFSADGKQLNIPLVNQLSSRGVGAGVLSGAEEQLDDYGFPIWTDFARNGVAFHKLNEKDSSFDIPSAARDLLRGWAKATIRNDIVDALWSLPTASIQSGRGSGTNGGNRVNGLRAVDAATTAANRNTWVTANVDRVLFGNAVANYSTTWATAAANVDSTNDKLTAASISLLKRIAQATTASGSAPAINPYMTEGSDEEWYVLFVGSRTMRDLRADTTMSAANREARPREGTNVTGSGGNPIFSGGSLVWDGVIVKEIPEITQRYTVQAPLLTAGASSIPVEPVFLCGQGALAYGVGQMPKATMKRDTDYDFVDGIGIEAQYGVAKIARANAGSSALKDFGMVTGFFSGTADG